VIFHSVHPGLGVSEIGILPCDFKQSQRGTCHIGVVIQESDFGGSTIAGAVEEAIAVGRGLEELDYLWIEEPLQEFDLNGLKRLTDTIDLPVMALESIPGNPYLATPYLTANAIDIVRQTGLGITGQMKLANLAEMFGKNRHGGNPHVVAAIRNDDWWGVSAWPPTSRDRSLDAAFADMIVDATEVRDGYMYVPQTPGLGRAIDWGQIEERTVAKI